MTTSFFNGITGLKSFQNGIDIWGNNISNINTTAYKENIPEFETLFSQNISTSPISSDIGLGSSLHSTSINLEEGSLINTDNTFDLALDNEGWFSVKKGEQIFYTRNGAFTKNKDGFLVNDSGAYLIGANANNLKKSNNGYIIDSSIDTSNLIKTGKFDKIFLPDNLELPAVPTTEINFSTNLQNTDTISILNNATDDLLFSALYDKYGSALNMKENQSFIYTLGDNISYSNGYIQKEICIDDDKVDGNDITYNFDVNGKNINITLPDSSTKKDIINALSNALDNNNIDYEKTDNSIILKSQNKLLIKSYNNLVKNAFGEKFLYKENPLNNNEFNTLSSLTSNLQQEINNVYENINISSDNGILTINNQENEDLNSHIYTTDNSNDLFINNLSSLNFVIKSKTSLSSLNFTAAKKEFGGFIYEANGDKDTISFTFIKKDVTNSNTIWKGEIKIIKNNKIISSVTQDFIFDNNGTLTNPTPITLSNPQNININLNLTSFNKHNSLINYTFEQNGISKGYLIKYEVDQNGNILANFSNNKSVKLATIPIYHFQNDQGLEKIDDSLYIETSNSNKAFLYEKNGEYIAGTKILSNMLETSNVNFTQAMTSLIINQKAFSAAAKTVTTSDEMIQKAINLKR